MSKVFMCFFHTCFVGSVTPPGIMILLRSGCILQRHSYGNLKSLIYLLKNSSSSSTTKISAQEHYYEILCNGEAESKLLGDKGPGNFRMKFCTINENVLPKFT